jgi:hypothetical protein
MQQIPARQTNYSGGGFMSKPETASFTCPECGFTLKTPFGKEDAAQHVTLHIDKHHNTSVFKARISKSELIKLQK